MGPALPIVAIATTVAGGAMSAIGSIQQGKAAAAQAQYQAGIAQINARQAEQNQILANQNAKYIEQGTAREMDDGARELRSVVGAQRAAMAANGLLVDSDTNAALQENTASLGNRRIDRIRESGGRQAYGQRIGAYNSALDRTMALTRSDAYRASGSAAMRAGQIGAITSILGAGSRAASMYGDMERTGVRMASIPIIS